MELGKMKAEEKMEGNDFSEVFQLNAVKNEPHDIDNFTKCESHFNSFSIESETYFVDHDHNYAAHSCPKQIEENLEGRNLNPEDLGHLKTLETSTGTFNTVGVKNEEIDIFNEDIKREDDKEKLSIRFCEMCYQRFGVETDCFKSTSYIFKCTCEEQNESLFYDIHGEDMTLEVKPSVLELADSELKPLEVQDEVPKKHDYLALPLTLLIPPMEKDNNMKRQLFLEPLDNILTVEEKKNKCKSGSKSPSQISNLKVLDEKPFNCKFCSKSFTRLNYLKTHERIHTGGEKPFQCKICAKSFNHKGNLKYHETVHTGEKPFQCKICAKSFNHKGNFKTHEMGHTGGEKPFQCKICAKSFNHKGYLKYHETVHTGEKPFQCKICAKSFNHKGNLKTHEMGHTGEKPFQCKICAKSFSRKGSLKIHEKGHTGEKPFHCSKVCSKSFSDKRSLKIHERSHITEKLFHCKLCSQCFSQKLNLEIHERVHTHEKLFHCKTYSKSLSRRSNLSS